MLSIGFDDTDSPNGMCTTYLAYKIVDLLKKEKAKFQDFPHLIRFNPNIPWKTRGNGAVGLKIKTKNPNKIKKKVTRRRRRRGEPLGVRRNRLLHNPQQIEQADDEHQAGILE